MKGLGWARSKEGRQGYARPYQPRPHVRAASRAGAKTTNDVMNEPSMNPFEPLIEAIAEAVVKKIGLPTGHTKSQELADRLLDAEEAARLLAVSEDWLYRKAKN